MYYMYTCTRFVLIVSDLHVLMCCIFLVRFMIISLSYPAHLHHRHALFLFLLLAHTQTHVQVITTRHMYFGIGILCLCVMPFSSA